MSEAFAADLEVLLAQEITENPDAQAAVFILLTNLHDLLKAAGDDPARLAGVRHLLATSREAVAAAVVANTRRGGPGAS
jgi:hypothetical protein